MSLEFVSFQVDRLIIHEIPKRTSEDRNQTTSLVVADIETNLEQTDKNFFAEKIKDSLLKSSYEVAFDESSNSPVPKHIFNILHNKNQGQDNFVSLSQQIAKHLYSCQTGVNPSGALVIASTRYNNKKSLAILKLEKEEGVEYEPEENNEGLVTFNIKQVKNVMMTGGKVFKVGLFISESEDGAVICGHISDKQRGIKSNFEVAQFFLKDFLGCYLLESAEITTKKFFKACQEFINTCVDKPELKARYQIALISLMQSNNGTIAPVNFAADNLVDSDRQKLISFLEEHQVPTSSFEKNTNSISSWTKAMYMKFSDSDITISVSGSPSQFGTVKVESIGPNRVLVSFEAELEKVGK